MKINSEIRNNVTAKCEKYLSNCLKRSDKSEHDKIKLLFNSLILGECDNEAIAALHLTLYEINSDSDDHSLRNFLKKMKQYGHDYINKQDFKCLSSDFEPYSKSDNIALLQTMDDTCENRAVIFYGLVHIFLKEKFDSDLISTLEKIIKYSQENKVSWPKILLYPTHQDKLEVEAIQKEIYKKADKFYRTVDVWIYQISKFMEEKFINKCGESHIVTLSNGTILCISVHMGANSKETPDFLLIQSMVYHEPPNYKTP